MRIELKGELKREITAGSMVHFVAKYKGMKLFEESLDLCGQISCPISPGRDKTVGFSINLPYYSVHLPVDVIATLNLPGGEQLVCLENNYFQV